MDSPAQVAYDAIAAVYDRFNGGDAYEQWLGALLLPELERHGLRHGRVLDVGCGTGRAFRTLLRRGWTVYGCDVSGGMLEVARRKFGSEVSLWRSDLRVLERAAERFDLVIALNDVINYLTEDGDLERSFGGVKRNLADGGLVCFDANALGVYERTWLSGTGDSMRERGWAWTGLSDEAAPGLVFEAGIARLGGDRSVHRQRHWPQRTVEGAMETAGLRCVAVLGQRGEGAELALDKTPTEDLHYKLIYIAAAE